VLVPVHLSTISFAWRVRGYNAQMRVLIVEDDLMIGEAVQVGLKNAFYAADWVKDGQTALDALSSQNSYLILLDLGLPGMDGLDVLTRIRAKGNSISAQNVLTSARTCNSKPALTIILACGTGGSVPEAHARQIADQGLLVALLIKLLDGLRISQPLRSH
jgi:CheY-like chemotaxis protein